jgi:hypothetical protein
MVKTTENEEHGTTSTACSSRSKMSSLFNPAESAAEFISSLRNISLPFQLLTA